MIKFLGGWLIRLSALVGCVTLIWAAAARATQTPLPDLFYSKNLALYGAQIECGFLIESCSIKGRHLLDGLYSFPATTISPDGQYMAVHLNDRWGVYRVTCLWEKPDCQPLWTNALANVARMAWGPDGSVIAYLDAAANALGLFSSGCWNGSLPESCFQSRVSLSDANRLTQPDWSGNGHYLLFIDISPNSFVLLDLSCLDDPAGCDNPGYQEHLDPFPGPSATLGWPSISQDGSLILYMSDTSGQGNDEQLFVLDKDKRVNQQLTFRHGASVQADWSSDERYIVFAGFASPRSGDLSIYVMDYERRLTALALHEEGQDLGQPAWGVAR